MILVVTGWRQHEDRTFIWTHLDYQLDACERAGERLFVRVGDATGADELTVAWCEKRELEGRNLQHFIYYADWDAFGSAAGPRRNQRMLTTEVVWVPSQNRLIDVARLADEVIGFPQPHVRGRSPGSGTWGCLMEAALHGISIYVPGYTRGE